MQFFGTLEQRSPTGGPRETFGGPWRNLDIICNLYVYYTVSLLYYFKQVATNHTNNFFIIKQMHFILIKSNFYDHYFIDVCTFFEKIHVSGPRDSKL
jgi:hypothetical protein